MLDFILLGILGGQELLLLVIVVVLILIFGNNVPKMVKTIGKNIHNVRTVKKDLEDDIFNIKNLLK